MRIAIVIILSIFLIFLGVQVWLFSTRTKDAQSEYGTVATDLERAKADAAALQTDYLYYLNPLNLEKELRSRFNYKADGEHMLIIVPEASSTN